MPHNTLPPPFRARTVSGSSRGKKIGTPTINLRLEDVPPTMGEGIYACTASLEGPGELPAVLHYGPRPVFGDTVSCEVHFLYRTVEDAPETLAVTLKAYLRPVRNFPDVEALKDQIQKDIEHTREILGV